MLTEGAVRATDKRALFIGLDAYVAAGGAVMNDLFQSDDGGWLQDVALVDRLVAEKLEREADAVRAEGWKWVEAALDLPYGHVYGLRRLRGEPAPLTRGRGSDAEAALQAEYDQIEQAHAGDDDLPEDVDGGSPRSRRRSPRSTTARSLRSDEIARAGAFVSIDGMGRLRVERGYVRPGGRAAGRAGGRRRNAEPQRRPMLRRPCGRGRGRRRRRRVSPADPRTRPRTRRPQADPGPADDAS